MLCPLMKTKRIYYREDTARPEDAERAEFEKVELQECIQWNCAWWDEEKNCCSVKAIAKELSRIQVKGINVTVARSSNKQ